METFFKVVGIIVVILLILRILGRFIFPILLKWVMKRFAQKMQQNFEKNFTGFNQQQASGDTTTQNAGTSAKSDFGRKKQKGEYVDFEEIRD